MDQLNTKRPDEITLPSRFQINDRVSLCIDGMAVQCKVHAIHFLPSKVKYDLDSVIAYYPEGGEAYTRLYNVDGACVTDPLKKGYDPNIKGSKKEDLINKFNLLKDHAASSLEPDEHTHFLKTIHALSYENNVVDGAKDGFIEFFPNEKGDFTISLYGEPVAICPNEESAHKLTSSYKSLLMRVDVLSKLDDGTVKVPLAEAKDLLHDFFNESSDSSPFSALVQENLERLFSEFVIRKYLK